MMSLAYRLIVIALEMVHQGDHAPHDARIPLPRPMAIIYIILREPNRAARIKRCLGGDDYNIIHTFR